MCQLVVARVGASGPGGRGVKRGTVLCADDPVVKTRPRLFVPYEVVHHCRRVPVETMTAGPGELREAALHHCDHPGCAATAKSPAGLAAHKRSHSGGSE